MALMLSVIHWHTLLLLTPFVIVTVIMPKNQVTRLSWSVRSINTGQNPV